MYFVFIQVDHSLTAPTGPGATEEPLDGGVFLVVY